MARKTDGVRPPKSGTKPGTALVPATGAKRNALVRIDDGVVEGALFRQDDVTLAVGRT